MQRICMDRLLAWKEDPERKPLILKGARQVGKTWLMKEFGRLYYESTAYFNFDEEEELKALFEQTKNPQRLIELLTMLHGATIRPGETLLIFDEIQECPAALNSLKYFCEEANEYHVVAAGSLLGTYLSQQAYPVGKVNMLAIYPLTFEEFLQAANEKLANIYRELKLDEAIPEIFHSQLLDAYNFYLIIGGMPECVNMWCKYRDPARVTRAQREILALYENDITKHNSKINAARVLLVYRSMVAQLSKENKKFSYGTVKKGARAREFEEAIEWLVSAGIVQRINNVSIPGYPLKSYEMDSHFKLYFLDVGLLKAMGEVENEAILFDKDFTFKGALAENFVLQQFLPSFSTTPHYYSPEPRMEIDFLLQYQAEIIPIEVKAGTTKHATSFKRYLEKYSPTTAIRYSKRNFRQEGRFKNVPLYMAGRW